MLERQRPYTCHHDALRARTSRDGQTSVLPSHPAGNINPRVSSRAVNGDLRGQKRRIRKGADCHRNRVRQIRKLPVQGRAAIRAEVIGDDLTAVADPRVRAGRACDLHLASGISRLNAKGAACPPLASQTVTNRNANGITLNSEAKLSAATACLARSHTPYSETNRQFQWTLACLESSFSPANQMIGADDQECNKLGHSGHWTSPQMGWSRYRRPSSLAAQ
jgi:hypothetical protein